MTWASILVLERVFFTELDDHRQAKTDFRFAQEEIAHKFRKLRLLD